MRHPDGTLGAIIQTTRAPFARMDVLQLALPSGLIQGQLAGRYFLARCGARTEHERAHNWSIYARRPLFVANTRLSMDNVKGSADLWTLTLPANGADPGAAWLRELPAGATVNLIGPLGRGFTLDRDGMNLLLIADMERLPALLPLIDPALDQRGRVTLLVLDRDADSRKQATLLDLLPLAAELHWVNDVDDLFHTLAEIIPWADQICVAMPGLSQTRLAALAREKRFRLEAGFVQVLVDADLVCGVGACLACVVPLANGGLTRACVHGPVLDLTRLAR